jgi:Phosphomannose isomerase
MDYDLSEQPFKFSENRVAYLIPGGSLIDRFYGRKPRKHCLESQAWIASVVQSSIENDGKGLSRLTPAFGGAVFRDLLQEQADEVLGETHVGQWGKTPGFLLKLLHSDDRLLVQTHPDKQKAMKYFHSPFGKTEAWYVVDVAEGKSAFIYAGFKPNVTRAYFKELMARQDCDAILHCLHRFEVQRGDVVLIKAGLPHALGADCLVAEIQEPTDITLRAERFRPDGSELPLESMHSGIGMEGLLDCFHFDGADEQETRKQIFIRPKTLYKNQFIQENQLIGCEDTPCFSMNLLTVQKGTYRKENRAFSVALVLEGEGELHCGPIRMPLHKGEESFIPHGVTEYAYESPDGMQILECYPPAFSVP